MKWTKCLVALSTLLLAACAGPPVRSDVSVFHRLGPQLAGKTFTFVTLNGQNDSLEHETYCDSVAQHLVAVGLRKADGSSKPNFAIAIDYFIGEPIQRTVQLPVFGQTGPGSTTTGTVQTYGNTSTVSANTTYTPTYGVTGYVASIEHRISAQLHADDVRYRCHRSRRDKAGL